MLPVTFAPPRLTHGPPTGVGLGRTTSNVEAGCETLATFLAKDQTTPHLHVFGHIHEARGAHVDKVSGRVSVNAANQPLGNNAVIGDHICTTGGRGWQAIIVDIKDDSVGMDASESPRRTGALNL